MPYTDKARQKEYQRLKHLANKEKPEYVAKRREYYRKHRERIKARNRQYKATNKQLYRDRHLRYTYSIDSQEFERMFNEQGGLCAVCLLPETVQSYGATRMLCVDHDHETGKVRKLLCSSCNRALGLLKDDIKRITQLLEYIRKFTEGAENGKENR